jgi:hypothetical protein
VGLVVGDSRVEQTALKAAPNKMVKHEKAYSDNQHIFISFAFDTFVFLAPETVNLLKKIQKVIHSNVILPKSMNVIFRIKFCCTKRFTANLLYLYVFYYSWIIILYLIYLINLKKNTNKKKEKKKRREENKLEAGSWKLEQEQEQEHHGGGGRPV